MDIIIPQIQLIKDTLVVTNSPNTKNSKNEIINILIFIISNYQLHTRFLQVLLICKKHTSISKCNILYI